MTIVKIEGKEYFLKARMGITQHLEEKFREEITFLDRTSEQIVNKSFFKSAPEKMTRLKIQNFYLRMVWEYLQPDDTGEKPFKTYKRFCDQIDSIDLQNAASKSLILLWGLDPEKIEPIINEQEGRELSPLHS